MPRQDPAERFRKAQDRSDIARAELRAAQAALAVQGRKADTRRKIVLGAVVLADATTNPSVARSLADVVARLEGRNRDAFARW